MFLVLRPTHTDRSMASFSDTNNSNRKERLSTTTGHRVHRHQGRQQRLLQAKSDKPTSPAPAPSVFRQWAEDLFSSSPRDWLSPSSCSGCLSQVDDHEGCDGDNTNDDVLSTPHASSRFNFSDHEESNASPSRDRGRFISNAGAESDIRKGARSIDGSPRLKNRSRASRHAHRKRINDLIETVESMVPSSLIRDQVLEARGQRVPRGDSSSSASLADSLIDDTLSQGSSSSVNVQIAKAPAMSTISSPYYTRSSVSTTAESKSSTLLSIPSRSHSLERISSSQVNTRLPTARLQFRRARSLQTQFFPTQLETKKNSPKSILDVNYFSWGQSSDDGEDLQRRNNTTLTQASPPRLCGQKAKAKGSKIGHEANDLTEHNCESGFFSNTVDLDWCCYSMHNSTVQEAPHESCGGYVDYLGEYHPCTKFELGQIMEANEPCQGCIFLQGMHDGRDGNEEETEELFYDSDPGQHFAITSWTRSQKVPSLRMSLNSATIRKKAKLGWRHRRKRRGKSNRGSSTTDNIISIHSGSRTRCNSATSHVNLQQGQDGQHAYLYDYFSRNEAMSTGFCSTQERDVHKHVQEALNSKWKLQCHVNITQKSNSPNQNHMPPIMCDLWIERGCRHSRTEIVEPKLMWSQTKLRDTRKLAVSTIRPYRVSLFAVRRIFQVDTCEDWENMYEGSQMKAPPMLIAKPNCLLVVRSSLGADYLFEASCPEERDHIVHLLKLVTARLVSHAVVGNGDLMVEEFFNEEYVAGGLDGSLLSTSDDD